MQNIKISVVSALKTATALYSLIADRVYFHYPNSFNTLPCLSYFEYNNAASFYCDNAEVGSEIIFQIDIWSNDSTSAISQAVDTIMVADGFERIDSRDLFENDTKIHHKSLKYRNNYVNPN